jgi:hypothetical protein
MVDLRWLPSADPFAGEIDADWPAYAPRCGADLGEHLVLECEQFGPGELVPRQVRGECGLAYARTDTSTPMTSHRVRSAALGRLIGDAAKPEGRRPELRLCPAAL